MKKAPNLGVIQWMSRVDSRITFISAITVGELRHGIALQTNARRRETLEKWLHTDVLGDFDGRILPFDSEVAERWGRIRAKARSEGSPSPVVDAMLIATAMHHNLVVVTQNETDFRRAGADVLNPWN